MARAKRRRPEDLDGTAIKRIIDELNSMIEGFDDYSPEDIAYSLDALTTMFLDAQLIPLRKLRRKKFHIAIEEFVLDLPERGALAESMETFEDLMNAYGDEPSEEEVEEAKEILEKVFSALKSAFDVGLNKSQLPLSLE
jgi:hypothetical protein